MVWHRRTSLTNFIIQQSRSFEGVYVLLRLTNYELSVPRTRLSSYSDRAFPLAAVRISSTAYHICSVTSCLLLSLEDTSSNSVTRNYCCRAREVTLSFMDTLIALIYLLISVV